VSGRLSNTDQRSQSLEQRQYWRSLSPEERLDIVEQLRLEAGKFLYEYPAPLQRVITVIRKHQVDQADVEELE
jgi:hypothetical protein